jgi:hypothetical protein
VGDSMNYLVRKPDAGKPHVRFDERGVETESTASYSGTSNRKGWSPLRLRLNFTAPLLDSTCAVRKAQDSSGRVERKPIRQISLQPVAVGAGEEATRRPEPSMEKAPLKGVSERAGRNANEH